MEHLRSTQDILAHMTRAGSDIRFTPIGAGDSQQQDDAHSQWKSQPTNANKASSNPNERPLSLSLTMNNSQNLSPSVSEYASIVMPTMMRDNGGDKSTPVSPVHSPQPAVEVTVTATTGGVDEHFIAPGRRVEARWGPRWVPAEIVQCYRGASRIRWLPAGTEDTVLNRELRPASKRSSVSPASSSSVVVGTTTTNNNNNHSEAKRRAREVMEGALGMNIINRNNDMSESAGRACSVDSVATELAVAVEEVSPQRHSNSNKKLVIPAAVVTPGELRIVDGRLARVVELLDGDRLRVVWGVDRGDGVIVMPTEDSRDTKKRRTGGHGGSRHSGDVDGTAIVSLSCVEAQLPHVLAPHALYELIVVEGC
eukprot:PhM_4_TR19137/c0_g1_i2/m.15093